jgi:soluble lytic murein transglycosylase-like protein
MLMRQISSALMLAIFAVAGTLAVDAKIQPLPSVNQPAAEAIIPSDLPLIAPTATPTPMPTATPTPKPIIKAKVVLPAGAPKAGSPVPAPADLEAIFTEAEKLYGTSAVMLKKIAKCESGFNPGAVSPSGAYHGMFQYVASTWVAQRNRMGKNPDPNLRHDARESIMTAAYQISKQGTGAWPVCQHK